MHAPSGQHANYQGSQQSMRADLPHLLRSHRTSLEGSKAKKQHSRGYVLAEQVAQAIKPWDAMTVVLEKLEKQAVLIKARSPVLLYLQNIPVADGLKQFKSARESDEDAYFRLGNARDIDEDAFVKIVSQSYPWAAVSQEHNDEIIKSDAMSVFGLMDSHASKQLSIGEWAGAMAAFFEGTQEEKARALFDLLDEHSKGWLSNEELQQRLIAPVKAMTPPRASPLLPLLVRFCADQVMESASIIDKSKISCQQCQDFIHWQSKSNDNKGLIDFIAKFVEEEIYKDNVQVHLVRTIVDDRERPWTIVDDLGRSWKIVTIVSDGIAERSLGTL